MIKVTIYLFFIICFLLNCIQVQNNESLNSNMFIEIENIKFLGHKGSGTKGRYGNKDFLDNSLNAALNGIKNLDGIEIDLQLSSDHTLWLFHDHEIPDCEDSLNNFISLNDEHIRYISNCRYNNELVTFQELIYALSKLSMTEKKHISLDIKALQNPKGIEFFGNEKILAEKVMQELKFLENYTDDFVFFVEIPFESQMKSFESFQGEVWVLCGMNLNCLDIARKYNAGVSLSIEFALRYPEEMKKLKKDRIPVQMWTPNTGTQLKSALTFEPDFIQTDNIPMIQYIQDINTIGKEYLLLKQEDLLNLKNEFNMLFQKKMNTFEQSFLLEIEFEIDTVVNQTIEELYLVISAGNGAHHLFWDAHTVKKGKNLIIEFIDIEFLYPFEEEELKVYFWNMIQENYTIKSLKIGIYKKHK